jgi:hypothetical protein
MIMFLLQNLEFLPIWFSLLRGPEPQEPFSRMFSEQGWWTLAKTLLNALACVLLWTKADFVAGAVLGNRGQDEEGEPWPNGPVNWLCAAGWVLLVSSGGLLAALVSDLVSGRTNLAIAEPMQIFLRACPLIQPIVGIVLITRGREIADYHGR